MQNYHEDERRTLTSIPYKNGEIKIIVTKKDCTLGNHYHKIKEEDFTLIEGDAICTIEDHRFDMTIAPKRVFVGQNKMHSFEIKKDSILFCVCSHPYNEQDDYTS